MLDSLECGIGGDQLNYNPKDAWDVKKSTEERVGWSNYNQQKPNLTEMALGYKRPPGFPNWIRLEKQVSLLKSVEGFTCLGGVQVYQPVNPLKVLRALCTPELSVSAQCLLKW